MSFNLSTLADIGGGGGGDGGVSSSDIDQTLHIAPELMGEAGQPPTTDTPHRDSPIDTQQPSSAYPNYANSNARGGDEDAGAAWDTTQTYGATDRQWDESEYTYDPNQPTVTTAGEDTTLQNEHTSPGKDENPKPKKRPRVSRPRVPKRQGEELLDFSQMVFENPEQDVKTGPMFIHPPPETAQACVRCHRIKRKCDQARPRCAGCSKSDVPCVFELSPATSLFVSLLKGDNASLSTQIASATERIAQLESVVSALERGGSAQSQFGIETDPRFFDNRTFTEADTDFSALARTILGARSTSTSDPSGSALPAYEVAQFAVESFFTNYDLVYPFLDKHELVKDMELAYVRLSEAFVPSTDESKGREFVLYMVFALGTVGREVNGDVEKGTAQRFKERATSHLSLVLASESLLSVQALTLLALYHLVSGSITQTSQFLALAVRTAISLGLHRRNDSIRSVEVTENRKRAFWSVYNLDRHAAVFHGQPLSIADSDINLELPQSLIFDLPVDGHSKAKVIGHIITYHQILSEIHTRLYSVNVAADNHILDNALAGYITETHQRLVNWNSTSPHRSNVDGTTPGDSQWYESQTNSALTYLHRPSPGVPRPTTASLGYLYEASKRCLDFWTTSTSSNSTPTPDPTEQAQTAISLLYFFSTYHQSQPSLISDSTWKQEVRSRLTQMQTILSSSSVTGKVKGVYDQLESGLEAIYGLGGGMNDGMDALADAIGVGAGGGKKKFELGAFGLGDRVVVQGEENEAWKLVCGLW